jgi:hypothetical protein
MFVKWGRRDGVTSYQAAVNWLNANQGVLAVAIVVVTGLFGWLSGIFSALRRRPRFKIRLIDGPTFACTFSVSEQFNGYDVHQTGIALYLDIANVGSAPSSIAEIWVGYHWNLIPFSRLWLKYSVGWHWLKHQMVALDDFQAAIGGMVKVYPFLKQVNRLSPRNAETYLQVGQSTSGVVYFEQDKSWGGCSPKAWKSKTYVRVKVFDTFGGIHAKTFSIPVVTLHEARKFNPAFGATHAEMTRDAAGTAT